MELRPSEISKFGHTLMEKATAIPGDQARVLREVESATFGTSSNFASNKKSNRNSLIKAPELFEEDEGYDLFDSPKAERAVRFQIGTAFRHFIGQTMSRRWVTPTPDSIPDEDREKLREYRDIFLTRCEEAIAIRRRQLMYLRSLQVKLQEIDTTIPSSLPQPAYQRQPAPLPRFPESTLPLISIPNVSSSQGDTVASEIRNPSITPLPPKASPSTVSSEGGELRDMGHFELSPPPKLEGWEKEKACPYCCLVFQRTTYDQRRNYKSWRRHLVEDMQPYICLFRHCSAEGKTYGTFME